jgi:F-type H+-transporting ATPase subunit b
MELLKLLNAEVIVVQIVCFLLLFFFLRAFGWKFFQKILDDRKDRIAGELRRIDDLKSNAEKLKSDYEGHLERIEETMQQKIKEATLEGRSIAAGIEGRAREEADRMIAVAKEDIQTEIAKAKAELKADVVELTVSAAEKIIRDKITDERDMKMISDFIDKAEVSHGD